MKFGSKTNVNYFGGSNDNQLKKVHQEVLSNHLEILTNTEIEPKIVSNYLETVDRNVNHLDTLEISPIKWWKNVWCVKYAAKLFKRTHQLQ